ncbi:hypothetical protein [Nocardia sp. BMG51109]|uniref:hypothetical protein n=1 Tax=Nocardia sp. BMG51109 TaxID=1056816 RepID=UPI0004643135|nr:hypothetical protein [Nocardia sp. BMG51109]
MTYSNLERRVTEVEAWLADIDYSYRESMHALTRACVRDRLETGRLIEHANRMGRGLESIMGRLGITGGEIGEIAPASAEEVEAALEAEAMHPLGRGCVIPRRPSKQTPPDT